MRISDWSSDVCSSDLLALQHMKAVNDGFALSAVEVAHKVRDGNMNATSGLAVLQSARPVIDRNWKALTSLPGWANQPGSARLADAKEQADVARSEEHTSELKSLMSISSAVFCLNKKKI